MNDIIYINSKHQSKQNLFNKLSLSSDIYLV